ncbi:uncharacterized protein (TIGR02145 family)/predicted secreted protein (Por secretion system target) [Chryseobacterium sp. 7]|uniref:T9SS type A sorting domain-containing protein n=1 Tax=Chryseobacterium sp. 7 TaxID=2035214 RepID=UPI000EAC45F5|nr:T9SS type A sorting domain-containing protein [Chryseobacterium sp. 7]RLJ33853.1 uncharacterized protein (TIGR02145 family)/predicted secreted protein (Por secretion system target) [Chryseobacterium sp. 7]
MRNLFLGLMLSLISIAGNSQNQQAYVAPGDLRTFLDYNIGADTSLPASTPSLGIKGDKFQWGASNKVDTSTDWNVSAPDNALSDATKTANDPCPSGYRIPTGAEWKGIIANNSVQWVGNFYEDGYDVYNRHTSGILINNSLFLPAAGTQNVGGTMTSNNASGMYWSTTSLGYLNYVSALVFYWSGGIPGSTKSLQVNSMYKPRGGNVRCIKDDSVNRLYLNPTETERVSKGYILYPNPAKSSFSLKLKNSSKVEIYDMLGNTILSKSLNESEPVNIESMNKGVYYVKITNEGNVYKETLLKNDN